jgi:hypothetical protein
MDDEGMQLDATLATDSKGGIEAQAPGGCGAEAGQLQARI